MLPIHKGINSSIILIVILSFFVSCKQPSKESVQLSIAEKKIRKNYDEGMRMMSQMPESAFCKESFYKCHNKQCIANVYFYKTQNHLNAGRLEEAQKSFLHYIKYLNTSDALLSYENEDNFVSNEQLFLKALMNADITDDRAMNALKDRLEYFKPPMDTHARIQENTTEYRILSNNLYWYSIILVFLCILVIQLFIKRECKYNHTLNCYKSKEEQLSEHIKQLTSQTVNHEVEIGQLTLLLNQLHSTNNVHLGRGKEIFEDLKAGSTMKNISIDDEQCFVDYYAFCHPQKYHKLISQYVSITLRHTTFLILSEMGYNDKEISNILFVKNSTIRNYKMRINKKQLKL